MTTVGEVCSKVAARLGLGTTGSFTGSPDETWQQLVAMVEQAGAYCYSRGLWQVGVKSAELLMIAQEDQGDIYELLGDLGYLTIDRAFYAHDAAQEIDVTVRENHLLISPAPAAGDTMMLFYESKAWLLRASDDAPVDAITSDNDRILLDRELMILATKAAWKLEKGLPAEADLQARNFRLTELLMRDGMKRTLKLDLGPVAEYDVGIVRL